MEAYFKCISKPIAHEPAPAGWCRVELAGGLAYAAEIGARPHYPYVWSHAPYLLPSGLTVQVFVCNRDHFTPLGGAAIQEQVRFAVLTRYPVVDLNRYALDVGSNWFVSTLRTGYFLSVPNPPVTLEEWLQRYDALGRRIPTDFPESVLQSPFLILERGVLAPQVVGVAEIRLPTPEPQSDE